MKKFLLIVLVLVLCLTACSCGSRKREYASAVPKTDETIDFSNSVSVISTPTPAPTEEPVFTPSPTATPAPSAAPAGTVTPAPIATPTPTPGVTIVPAPTAQVVTNTGIVKNPTGETVEEGGTAKFICYTSTSQNASWIIKAPGNIYGVPAEKAPESFPGLQVSGQNTSTLTLSNIPLSMNGAKIQAHFGDDYSANALLTVKAATVQDSVKKMANNCLDQYAYFGTKYGYGVSGIQGYTVTDGLADFNIFFIKDNLTVVGEFNANSEYFRPIYAIVQNSAGEIIYQTAILSDDPSGEFSAVLQNPNPISGG